MTASLWALPGPRGYIADIVGSIARGRHVVAVLPEYLSTDDVATSLADELVAALDDAAHVSVGADRSLIEQVCVDVSDDFDEHPVSVRELMTWANPRASTFVVNSLEIDRARRPELRNFLERLAHDSRATAEGSIRLVVIAGDVDLPSSLSPDGDVTVTTRWFWNRVARWDTVAHVALGDGGVDLDTLIDEIRVETIVELARWDLVYANAVAGAWEDGSLQDLQPPFGRDVLRAKSVEGIAAGKVGAWPPARLITAWNSGAVDGWRGRVSVAPSADMEADHAFERHVWAAQARVLLPFIETKRARLEAHLRSELGPARFDREVASRMLTSPTPNHVQAPVPEIALLREISRLARRDDRRRKTLDELRDARNRLSHLVPLSHSGVIALEKACLWLG